MNIEKELFGKDYLKDLEKLTNMSQQGAYDDELALSVFKKQVDVTIKVIVSSLYDLILEHPIICAYSRLCKLKDCETMRDINDNIETLGVGVRILKEKSTEKSIDKFTKEYQEFGGVINKDWLRVADDFAQFYAEISSFVGTAVCIVDKQASNNKAYFKSLNRNLQAMVDALENASKYIDCFAKYERGYDDAFLDMKTNFADAVDHLKLTIDRFVSLIIAKSKATEVKEESQPLDRARLVKMAQNAEIQVREENIKEANDLWQMFKLDFMRDLNKEVSMMNRDMYEALMLKIEKFLKQFPMPLDNSVSSRMAIEAKAQINKFIETVGEISRNTYTPIVMNRQ